MKIGRTVDMNAIADYKIANALKQILRVVDGQLSVGDNIAGVIVRRVFFVQANFDLPVEHNAGRVLSDFIILNKDKFADFKKGNVSATQTRTYIQCDTAGTTADILFLG